MTPSYEATIIREFGKFVEQGGVYKGLKPVLWCTQDQTALAEAEVEYDDHVSPSVYVKFPVVTSPAVLAKTFPGVTFPDGAKLVSVVIWTTTPWTLPANQAVCLHRDIDYAFAQVGDEILIIAEKLLEAAAKACKFEGYRVLGVKKGGEGLRGWKLSARSRPDSRLFCLVILSHSTKVPAACTSRPAMEWKTTFWSSIIMPTRHRAKGWKLWRRWITGAVLPTS